MAKFRTNKYKVVGGILKAIAVQSLLYDMDTINWSAEEVNKLEVIKNKIGRLGLGANNLGQRLSEGIWVGADLKKGYIRET